MPLVTVFSIAKQFIPARGRKPSTDSVQFSRHKETIHPRKGTETVLVDVAVADLKKQFIPARGRKPRRVCALRRSARGNNSSPQGDGNAFLASISNLSKGNNSSPQGDGNFNFFEFFERVVQKQFIPARGRKHGFSSILISSLRETIHPRKGTETLN